MRIKTHEHISESGSIPLNATIYTKPYVRFQIMGEDEELRKKVPLPDIRVSLMNYATAMPIDKTSDENGLVYFDNLIAGYYRLEVTDPNHAYGTIEKRIAINKSSEEDNEIILSNNVLPEARVTILDNKTSDPVYRAHVRLSNKNDGTEFNEYTDEDGIINYTNFPAGVYVAEVDKEGFDDYREVCSIFENNPYITIKINPKATGMLHVIVKNYYQEPIPDANLKMEDSFGHIYTMQTDEYGTIDAPNIVFGEYTAEITHNDYFTYVGTINFQESGLYKNITLSKKVINRFKIRSVKDSETEALLQGVECTFVNKETFEELNVVTDNEGEATVENIPAGQYSVRFQHDLYKTHIEETITVDDSHTSLEVSLTRNVFTDIKFTTCDVFTRELLANKEIQIVEEEHAEPIKGVTGDDGVFKPESIIAGYYIIIANDKNKIGEIPIYESYVIEHQMISNSSQHDFLLQLSPSTIPFVNLKLVDEGTGEVIPNQKVLIDNELKLESNDDGIVKVENYCRHGRESSIGIFEADEIVYNTTFVPYLDSDLLDINVPSRGIIIPNYKIIVKDKDSGDLLPDVAVTYNDDKHYVTYRTNSNGEVNFINMAVEGKSFSCEVNGDYHDTESFEITPVSDNPQKVVMVQRAKITFMINVEDNITHHRLEGATIEFTNSNGDKITGTSDEDGMCKFIDYESYNSTYTATRGGYDSATGALNLNKYCNGEVYLINMTQNNNCNVKLTFVSQMGSKPTSGTATLSKDGEEYSSEVSREGEAVFTNIPEGTYEINATFGDIDAAGKESYSECIDTVEVYEFNVVKEIAVDVKVAKGRIGLKVGGATVGEYYFTYVNSNIQNMFVESMVPQNIDIPDVKSDVIFSKDGKSHIFEVIPRTDKGTIIMGQID